MPENISWVRVGDWEVSSIQFGPVGIGEAEAWAKREGCELPTVELVNEIWRAADLRIDPPIRAWKSKKEVAGMSYEAIIAKRWHDGSPKTMSVQSVYDDQWVRISEAIGNREFTLMTGAFKDVVRLPEGGIGLYGWIDSHGIPQQSPYGGHRLDWKDYSQGVRLCRRVA